MSTAALAPGSHVIFDDFGVRRHLTVKTWGDILESEPVIFGAPMLPRETLCGMDSDKRFWEIDNIRDGIVDSWEAGCCCAHNLDGSVTTMLCPLHAEYDPCAGMAAVTGKRRKGSIIRGRCTACGWTYPGLRGES